MSTHHHRSTLKQQNKSFKSKHASKSSIKEKAKGRVPINVKRSDPRVPPLPNTAQAKQNRRNQARQVQKAKRQSLIEATRIFNGVDGAPRIVAVVPLSEDVSSREVVLRFVKCLDDENSTEIEKQVPEEGVWQMRTERFRSSLQFILLPYGQLLKTLDATKVADYTILCLSTEQEVDSQGDTLLRCLQAQGFPQVVAVISQPASIEEKKTNPKLHQNTLKSLLSFTQYFVPSLTRIFDISSVAEASTALRSLCEGKPLDIKWRTGRPYLLAEDVQFTASSSEMEEGVAQNGVLQVTGVIRGAPLSADRLVYLQIWGDFTIGRIIAAPRRPRGPQGDGTMEVEDKVLGEPGPEQDDLVEVNEVDDMGNEQTWPTEEEMREKGSDAMEGDVPDAPDGTTPKAVRRVPKGTSAYQAAWLLEDEEIDSDEDGSNGSDDENGDTGGTKAAFRFENMSVDGGDSSKDGEVEEKEEYEDIVEEEQSSKAVAFEDMDMEEEKRQLDSWRARQKEHSTHLAFPDEIDTPMDIPARQRFARYRGLRSFRTSPWDPDENLPRDYAKIFRVGEREWDSVGRRLMDGGGEGVEPGTRVTVEILDVPEAALKSWAPGSLFAVFGLHKHEHKQTVLNFTLQRNSEYTEPIRSKDRLIMCVGPRRLVVNPLFSQHLRGGTKSANNVHKFERFLREGVTSVGTIYGPMTFGRLPITLLKETEDGKSPTLVATGTLLPPSTTRIISKRILLTGHPIKIHKRTVTIRYMFFNPQDVAYFKPVQLHTKYGKVGHIQESLGTHGYFKAHFDGPVSQMDTVCLALYKRVWPRWSSEWSGGIDGNSHDDNIEEMVE